MLNLVRVGRWLSNPLKIPVNIGVMKPSQQNPQQYDSNRKPGDDAHPQIRARRSPTTRRCCRRFFSCGLLVSVRCAFERHKVAIRDYRQPGIKLSSSSRLLLSGNTPCGTTRSSYPDYRGCIDHGFDGITNAPARQASELYDMVFVTHSGWRVPFVYWKRRALCSGVLCLAPWKGCLVWPTNQATSE
jgi:hypothetical protein